MIHVEQRSSARLIPCRNSLRVDTKPPLRDDQSTSFTTPFGCMHTTINPHLRYVAGIRTTVIGYSDADDDPSAMFNQASSKHRLAEMKQS